MGRSKEIPINELEGLIGNELAFLNNDYIFKYFSITPEQYSKLTIDLKAIANSDGSYSIYEQENGKLLTMVKKAEGGHYFIVPIGLAQILASKVLNTFNLIELNEEFAASVYQTFYMANEMGSEFTDDKLDQFLFYLGIIITDMFNFDIYESIAQIEADNFLLDGTKFEFVYLDDKKEETSYEEVAYLVTAAENSEKVNIMKIYQVDREEDIFWLSLDELINKAYDEFRGSKT